MGLVGVVSPWWVVYWCGVGVLPFLTIFLVRVFDWVDTKNCTEFDYYGMGMMLVFCVGAWPICLLTAMLAGVLYLLWRLAGWTAAKVKA